MFKTFNLIFLFPSSLIKVNNDSLRLETFALSPFFDEQVDKYLISSVRYPCNLMIVASLLASAPEDCYPRMIDYTDGLLKQLQQVNHRVIIYSKKKLII